MPAEGHQMADSGFRCLMPAVDFYRYLTLGFERVRKYVSWGVFCFDQWDQQIRVSVTGPLRLPNAIRTSKACENVVGWSGARLSMTTDGVYEILEGPIQGRRQPSSAF